MCQRGVISANKSAYSIQKLKAVPRIEFTYEDLSGVHLLYEDALVVTF